MNYAERLKAALNTKNMSQSELARHIGVKPQAIQYLCSGKAIGSKYTSAIADALEVSSTWLGNGQGEMFNSSQATPPPEGVNEASAPYSKESIERLKRIEQLSPTDAARLDKILDAFDPPMDGNPATK